MEQLNGQDMGSLDTEKWDNLMDRIWKVWIQKNGKFGYRNAHPYMESYFRLDG